MGHRADVLRVDAGRAGRIRANHWRREDHPPADLLIIGTGRITRRRETYRDIAARYPVGVVPDHGTPERRRRGASGRVRRGSSSAPQCARNQADSYPRGDAMFRTSAATEQPAIDACEAWAQHAGTPDGRVLPHRGGVQAPRGEPRHARNRGATSTARRTPRSGTARSPRSPRDACRSSTNVFVLTEGWDAPRARSVSSRAAAARRDLPANGRARAAPTRTSAPGDRPRGRHA